MKKKSLKKVQKQRDPRNLELTDENLEKLLYNVIGDVMSNDMGIRFPETEEEIEKILREVDMPERLKRTHEVQGSEAEGADGSEESEKN